MYEATCCEGHVTGRGGAGDGEGGGEGAVGAAGGQRLGQGLLGDDEDGVGAAVGDEGGALEEAERPAEMAALPAWQPVAIET